MESQMRRAVSHILRMLVGVLLGTGVAQASSLAPLKNANRLFVKGHYDEALKAYSDALVDAPNSPVLHYNAGDAAYQTGDFAKAEHEFQQAEELAIPPLLKSAAWYNRGNALYRQQRRTDAIEAYKEALRINPTDADAKYNLGVALEDKKNQSSGNSQNNNQNQKQNDKKDSSKGSGQGKENNPSSGNQPKPGEMSREDVDRLLEAARSGELKKSNQKAPKSDVPHPEEDW